MNIVLGEEYWTFILWHKIVFAMFKVTIQSGGHNTTQHTSVVAAAEVVTQRIIDCSKNLIADHYTCLAESSVEV